MRQRGVGGECCNHVRLQYNHYGNSEVLPCKSLHQDNMQNFLLEQLPMNIKFMVFSVLNVDYYVIHQVAAYSGFTEQPSVNLAGLCLFIYLPISLPAHIPKWE